MFINSVSDEGNEREVVSDINIYKTWRGGGSMGAADKRLISSDQTLKMVFNTEGEQRCCSTGRMRTIESCLNIKAWRHVIEALNVNLKKNTFTL